MESSGGNFLSGLLSSFGIQPHQPATTGQTPGIVQAQPIVQPNSNQKPIPTESAPKNVADIAKSIASSQPTTKPAETAQPKATEVAQKPSEVIAAPVKAITDQVTAMQPTATTAQPAPTITTEPVKPAATEPTVEQPQPVIEKPIEAKKPQIPQAINLLNQSAHDTSSTSPLSGLLSNLISGNTPEMPSLGDIADNMLQGLLGGQSIPQQPTMGGLTQEDFTSQVIDLLTDIAHHTDNLGLMLQIMQQQAGIKVTPAQVANAQKGNSLSDRLAERLKSTTTGKGTSKQPIKRNTKRPDTDGLSKLQAYADATDNDNISMIKNLMESLASS